ncbi:MAG: hypothetical protein ACTSVM_06915, partial [Candidatus Ranarchaeia archaeon]
MVGAPCNPKNKTAKQTAQEYGNPEKHQKHQANFSWALFTGYIDRRTLMIFGLGVLIRSLLACYHDPVFKWMEQNALLLLRGSLELYQDYDYYYVHFAESFVHGIWVPYTQSVSDAFLQAYTYPPFFLYAISIPAIISSTLVFVPILLADIMLPILVGGFLANTHGQRVARWGFTTTAFCPILILYNGGFLFNTALVLLVFVFALYLSHNKRYLSGTLFLSIALLFKQIIVFIVPPIIIYNAIKSVPENASYAKTIKQFILHCSIFVLMLLIGSFPWILFAPTQYIGTLLMGASPTLHPDFVSRGITWPIRWYDFLVDLAMP